MQEFETTLTIKGTEYKAVFNTYVLRKYSEAQGIKTVDEAVRSLLDIAEPETDETGKIVYDGDVPRIKSIKWSGLDAITMFILCGIKECARVNKTTVDIEHADVYSLTGDAEGLNQIIQLISNQMPTAQPAEPGGNQ